MKFKVGSIIERIDIRCNGIITDYSPVRLDPLYEINFSIPAHCSYYSSSYIDNSFKLITEIFVGEL